MSREGDNFYLMILETVVSEEKKFRKTYFHELPRCEFEGFDTVELVLKCYHGRTAKAPLWLDLEPGSLDNDRVFRRKL